MAIKKTTSKKKIETPKKNVGNSLADKSAINQLKGISAPYSKKKVEVIKRSTSSAKKTIKKTSEKTVVAKNDPSIFTPLSEEKLTQIKSENKNDSIFSPKENTTKKLPSEDKIFSTDKTNSRTSTSSVFIPNNTTNGATEYKDSIETSGNIKTVKEGDKKIESIDDLLEAINVAKEKRENKESNQMKNSLGVNDKQEVNKTTSIDGQLKTNAYKKDVIDNKSVINKEESKKTESIDSLLKTINTVKERKEDKDKAFYDKRSYNVAKYKSLNKKKNKLFPLVFVALFLIIGAGIIFFVMRQNNNEGTIIVASSLLESMATNETEYIYTEIDTVDNNIIIQDTNVLDGALDKDESSADVDITANEDDGVKEDTEYKTLLTEKQEETVNKEIELEDNIDAVVVNDNIIAEAVMSDGDYEIYTLKWKESIRTVAIEKLGDERRWTTIYRLNSDVFKSPDLYFFGDKIRLPKNKKSSNDMTNQELLSLIEDYKFTIASYEKEGNRLTDINRLNAIIKLLNEKIK